jgi:acetyl esterase/lipase
MGSSVSRVGRVLGGAAMVASLLASWAFGAGPAPEGVTFPLWPGGVPGSLGDDPARDVPTLSYSAPAPEKATGAAVVVCPGGGYGMLAADHEGRQVAEWLNRMGLAAFVLKYRLGPRYHHPAMLQDAGRAIRTVRARAGEWHLDPNRVAILGFSAGGHLASTAGTHFDAGRADDEDPVERVSSRPDRMLLLYPVISLNTPYAHAGSRRNLLGEDPPAELVAGLSNETQVTPQTPPTFLVHTNEDTVVPPENSLLFALALRKARVPLELHVFEKGRHGLGLGEGLANFKPTDKSDGFRAWPGLCETWLRGQGFLTKE